MSTCLPIQSCSVAPPDYDPEGMQIGNWSKTCPDGALDQTPDGVAIGTAVAKEWTRAGIVLPQVGRRRICFLLPATSLALSIASKQWIGGTCVCDRRGALCLIG